MDPDDQFAQWALLFASAYSENDPGLVGNPAPPESGVQYLGVTPAACQLLRAVDAGGVPAFVSNNLKQIARDNGIEVTAQWTPNEIVEALRAKSSQSESAPPGPSG